MTESPRKPLSLKPKATPPVSDDQPIQRKSRSGKRIIRRDELPAAKLSSTKPPPKPIPKRKPPAAPKAPTTPPSTIRAGNLKASLNAYRVWMEYYPLALGIQRQIFQHIARHSLSASKRVVHNLLVDHVSDRRYLAAVAAGGHRFNLDGTEAGVITEAERAYSSRLLGKLP